MQLNGCNYRVLKTKIDGVAHYTIIEVTYDENNEPIGWIDSENALIWLDYNDLKGTVSLIQLAFDKPIMVVENGRLKEIV